MLGRISNPIIRNSWYCMEKDLKRVFVISSALAIVILIVTCITQNVEIIYGFLGGVSTISVTTPFAVRKKDKASKWDKFVHILPISRTEIVKSQFRFLELVTLLFVAFVFLMSCITLILPLDVDLKQVSMVLVMSISIGVVGQSVMYTLSLKVSDMINDIFIMLSILVSIIPSILPAIILNRYFESYPILMYIVLSLLLIMAIEFICYLLCQQFMKVKEF